VKRFRAQRESVNYSLDGNAGENIRLGFSDARTMSDENQSSSIVDLRRFFIIPTGLILRSAVQFVIATETSILTCRSDYSLRYPTTLELYSYMSLGKKE
jgi:hypothetical protein